MKILNIINLIPLMVRLNSDKNDALEIIVFYNLEENRILEYGTNILTESLKQSIIEIYGANDYKVDNYPKFNDYITLELKNKIDAARQGNTSVFDDNYNSTFEEDNNVNE